jgi:hypothetical protein
VQPSVASSAPGVWAGNFDPHAVQKRMSPARGRPHFVQKLMLALINPAEFCHGNRANAPQISHGSVA